MGGNLDEIFRQNIDSAINMLTEVEFTSFLGYERYDAEGYNTGESRNGSYIRTGHSRFGNLQIKASRDWKGAFQQQTIAPYVRNMDSLEETIIYLYYKRNTTLESVDLIEKRCGYHHFRSIVSNMTAPSRKM